jgi:predicted dehydrogenase
MPKINVGVIGTGSIGNVHLTGYSDDPRNVNIQAICDINPTRLAEMGEKFKVSAEHRYRDYNKMLATEELDAVSVCTPNKFHFEMGKAVLESDRALLLEKPMVLTMPQARDLKKVLAAHPQKFMVAFSHRFIPVNIQAKKLLDKGAIGKPFMIRVRYAHTGPFPGWAQGNWFYKKNQAGGGALLDMGIHAIDICHYLVGPIASVQAEVKTLRKDIEVDDNAVMLLDFGPAAKCLGYIEVGWTSPAGFAGIEIYGDKGCITLELGKDGKVVRGVHRPDGSTEAREEVLSKGDGKSHWPKQMESFIRYCLGKSTVTGIPGIDEGMSSLAVALAAGESSKTGKRVKIKR